MDEEMQHCSNYEDLEFLVDGLDESRFEDLHLTIMEAGPDAEIDQVVAYHYPRDGLKNLFPMKTDTDGKCFICAVSRCIFGTEE